MERAATTPASRAWYGESVSDFLNCFPDSIIGTLARNADFALVPEQRDAWLTQIDFLHTQLKDLTGSIFLEFNIPRMGRRIDTVLLVGGIVFVIEFKVGEKSFDRAALDQVWDYALDLKNFHQASHALPILPILIATAATQSPEPMLHRDDDAVYRPIPAHPRAFRGVLDLAIQTIPNTAIDHVEWSRAPYRPTPTIVEAARALYAQHSVEAIARSDAGAQNLHITSRRLEDIVDQSNVGRRKAICFVTGVPGAGKTLVGLNIATRRSDENQPTHAVFLSGNGPLVAVLREALTRDEVARRKAAGEKVKKGRVGERVKAFIQNVHHFRDEALIDPKPPHEHVAIFDEAQRAWNLKQTASFMQRKKKRSGFSQSEPEFLISYMDRHQDWSVVICLVGGGQEIHRGEAGIDAWLDAVSSKFPHWDMHISSRLTDTEYAAGRALDKVSHRPNTHLDESLHLGVSMRSFRAENVSSLIKALLDCEKQQAREAFANLSDRYPIILTRNLDHARDWVRARARGTERYGLVASSKAQRLKPHAVDIRVDVDPVHYFLCDRSDTRSSYYLEDAATEFQVQGLELDWTCVTWDADLRFTGSGWSCHDFRGDRWCNITNTDNRAYLRNAYRVLLTRARQGMVIFVPPGNSADPTRSPAFYDSTFGYLADLGIPALP
jgi:hypothetical protein